MNRLFVIIVAVLFYSTGFGQTYNFDFQTGQQGWIGDFADYPIGQTTYQLGFQWSSLPSPLNISQKSLFITGNNHSDDLFMFIKKKIIGLLPNTTYAVTFDIEFASKYPTNAVGVGGAPGEGVTMKAGATIIEPDTIHYFGDVRMNIDKGNQMQRGVDMDTIGHVGVNDTTTVYALKTNNNFLHPFTITTNSSGEVWIIIATDSGFEATTTLYYNEIDVVFSNVTGINENTTTETHQFVIYPNPSNDLFRFISEHNLTKIEIYTITGQLMKTINKPNMEISTELSNGVYLIRGFANNNKIFNQKVLITK